MKHEKPFVREDRYIVLKKSDLVEMALSGGSFSGLAARQLDDMIKDVSDGRAQRGKPDLECVVVEKDWPEYELVWALLEARIRVQSVHPDLLLSARYYSVLGDLYSLAKLVKAIGKKENQPEEPKPEKPENVEDPLALQLRNFFRENRSFLRDLLL